VSVASCCDGAVLPPYSLRGASGSSARRVAKPGLPEEPTGPSLQMADFGRHMRLHEDGIRLLNTLGEGRSSAQEWGWPDHVLVEDLLHLTRKA
jgi:hypothetical protein